MGGLAIHDLSWYTPFYCSEYSVMVFKGIAK